jgi:hypothetical protein
MLMFFYRGKKDERGYAEYYVYISQTSTSFRKSLEREGNADSNGDFEFLYIIRVL